MNRRNRLFAILFVLFLASMQFAQDPPNKTGIKFITETIKESNNEKRFDIDVSYPAMAERSAMAGAFNKAVKDHVMVYVNEFRGFSDEMTDEDRKFLPEGVNYTLDFGYEIEHAGDEFISVSFGRSTYTGGAHPNHWTTTLNFDRKEMKELALSDLFKPNSGWLKKISDHAIADLTKQMDDFADEDWISRGAGPDAENFRSWAITDKGLKFFFDPYQVGPYAAGPFETVIGYENFPFDMQSEKFYSVKTVSYVEGNPPNWCRNGHFPSRADEFSIFKVNGDNKTRAYFYGDDGDCPNGANCRKKAYVIGGDEIITAGTYGDFVCAWYQPAKGSETVGWIRMGDVRPGYGDEGPASWTGRWEGQGNDITIESIGAGRLSVKGNAFWKGVGDNIHIGEIDDAGTPVDNVLNLGGSDEYDCRVKMTRIGKYMIVTDNKQCGGVNVSFDGVYLRKN
ncbi:MAG: DUF3298 and DUF4163 domain-containing protein [Acidobacteriota bacterium]|nr:MAG: DUF3298 and DUF4163 domain-containing protein [Acidobacteriota bacterium]